MVRGTELVRLQLVVAITTHRIDGNQDHRHYICVHCERHGHRCHWKRNSFLCVDGHCPISFHDISGLAKVRSAVYLTRLSNNFSLTRLAMLDVCRDFQRCVYQDSNAIGNAIQGHQLFSSSDHDGMESFRIRQRWCLCGGDRQSCGGIYYSFACQCHIIYHH